MVIIPLHSKPWRREIITGEKENDFMFKDILQTYAALNTVKCTRRFGMQIFRNRNSFLLDRQLLLCRPWGRGKAWYDFTTISFGLEDPGKKALQIRCFSRKKFPCTVKKMKLFSKIGLWIVMLRNLSFRLLSFVNRNKMSVEFYIDICCCP